MKTPAFVVAVLFSLLPVASAQAELSAAAWLETYYLEPQPGDVPRFIHALSRADYFARRGNTAQAIGFLATIFAQHPDRVDGWLLQLNGLPLKTNKLLAAALWQAGHPLGPDLLRILGQLSPLRDELERLAGTPVGPILETPVRSASSLKLQWGAFYASGDARHLLVMFDAIGSGDPALAAVVSTSIVQHASAHWRVLEICRSQLERQPEEVRVVLRAAIAAAEPRLPHG